MNAVADRNGHREDGNDGNGVRWRMAQVVFSDRVQFGGFRSSTCSRSRGIWRWELGADLTGGVNDKMFRNYSGCPYQSVAAIVTDCAETKRIEQVGGCTFRFTALWSGPWDVLKSK